MMDRDGFGRRLHLVVPVLVAALLRAAHLLFLAGRDPLFAHPVVDEWFHEQQALAILRDGWLLPGHGAFYKGPLHSYYLAVLISWFGSGAAIVAARIVSAIGGTVSVLLVARLAERLAGPRAAWVAGLAAAVYGTAVYFDATLLLEPLAGLMLLSAAERLVAAGGARRPALGLAAAGILLGLLTTSRPNALLAVLAGAAWAARTARPARPPFPAPLRAAAWVLLPALLVISPVTARNVLLERDPVLVSWNGGINLFLGNDPGFDQGSGNWHPDLTWTRVLNTPRELGLTRGSEHQRFYLRQAAARAAERPAEAARILATKSALLLSAYEISNNRRIDDARRRSPVLAALMPRAGRLAMPWSLFGPLLAAGLVLATRTRPLGAAPLVWLAAAWLVAPILVFNTARYRLSAILLLMPLAAAGWTRFRWTRETRRTIVTAVTFALALLVVSSATFPVRPTLPPSDRLRLAEVADREGRRGEALEWYRSAVEEDSDDPFARARLGDWLRRERRCEDALPHYDALVERTDLVAEWRLAAMRNAARCQAALGRADRAVEQYRSFLAADPDRPRTAGRPDFHLRGTPPVVACVHRLELAAVLDRAGRPGEAVAERDRVATDCAATSRLAEAARQDVQRSGVRP